MGIVDEQVDASEDDADERESDGLTAIAPIYTTCYDNTSGSLRYYGAMRWVASIPQGSTITTAYIEIYVRYTFDFDDPHFQMHFEKGADPAAFTTDDYDISGRTRTTDKTTWDAIDVGKQVWVESPSLVVPLQEVVDSYSTTHIALIAVPGVDGSHLDRKLTVNAYDGLTEYAPKLYIQYASGGDIRNLTGQATGGVRQFQRGSIPGQPTRIRTWGIPTGPGWFDRPGKWNYRKPFDRLKKRLEQLGIHIGW